MSQIVSAKLGHTGVTEIENDTSMTQFSLTRDNSLKGKLPSSPQSCSPNLTGTAPVQST